MTTRSRYALAAALLALFLHVCAPAASLAAETAETPPDQEEGGLSARYLAGKLYAQAAFDAEKLSRAYESEMDKAGFYKLLNVQRLQADPDLAKGKAIVAAARELAKRYEVRSQELVKQGAARIQSLEADEETRSRIAASWERVEAEARAEVAQAWKLENAVIDRMAEVADLLARAKGTWSVNGQNLSFDRAEDSAEYRRRIAAAKSAMQAQETFQSQAQKKAFKRLLEIVK